MDEAKHIFNQNYSMIENHITDHMKQIINDVQIELEIESIHDQFGPVSQSSSILRYLNLPDLDQYKVFFVDSESDIDKIDLLMATTDEDEPIGIDSEWRPSMNVFHVA